MTSHGFESSVLSDVVLPVALAVIMVGMGLSLTRDDFRRVARTPRAVAIGLGVQVVALPLLASAVGIVFYRLLGFEPILVMGLLLLACCPGGATSNLVTYLARADAALSVTVTSVNSLAAAVTTPLAFFASTRLVFGSSEFVSVSFLEMGGLVLLIVVLPVLFGMWVRSARPVLAARLDRPMKPIGGVFLALVVVGVILQNRAQLVALAAAVVPPSLVLNLLALGVGLGIARAAKLHRKQARAVAIEVSFQNGTLGIAIALTQLNSPQAAIVPGFYSLVMFATGAAVAWWWARDERIREGDATAARAPS